jgi:DNA-binding NtrC family response regulator
VSASAVAEDIEISGAVLIVDDDPSIVRLLEHTLARDGFAAVSVLDGASARAYVAREAPEAIILDLGLPDVDGKVLLADLIERRPDVPILVLTASDTVEDIVECMRLGAVDYIQKPFDRTRVTTSLVNATRQANLQRSVEKLSGRLRSREGFASIIGNSLAIRQTVDLLSRAATNDVVVLLQGESGTGKEVAARSIHVESPRREGPFVTVNCGAIPEGLIESELFGHERGSFTGAIAARLGSFEQANGGTIFLDEIGELRMDLQVRLLRILQDRSVRPIGGSVARPIDVRVIAASNRDLKEEVARENFREDLYYRLAVFPITLPPLRDRGTDTLLLADAFVARYAESVGKRLRGFSPEARHLIESYGWPGNVRELENVIERAVILEDGGRISVASLPDIVARGAGGPASAGAERARMLSSSLARATALTADDIVPLEEEERRIIRRALELTDWDAREASRRLRIGRATIYRKIERYGLRGS